MSSSEGNFIALVLLIAVVVAWCSAGMVAWDWISPDSFGESIIFLIAWGVLGKIFEIVLGGILYLLFDRQ